MKVWFYIFIVSVLTLTSASINSNAAAPPLKEWQKCIGGSQLDIPVKIERLKNGKLLMLSNVDSHDGDISSNHGSTDMWLTKLDSSGNILWEKSFGGSSIDVGTGLIELENGNIILSGYSSSNNNDIPLNHGNFDAFLMCLDSNANILLVRVFGGTQVDLCYSLISSREGGFILGGGSYSSDGDLTANNGDQDFWLIKTDINGNLLWQKSAGGNDVDVCYTLGEDSLGNIYAGGTTNSISGFVTNQHGNYDLCILKFDFLGNTLWAKSFGGSNYETAQVMLIDSRNKILVGGYSRSSDGNLTSNYGYSDSWIIQINENGNLVNEKNIGGSGGDNMFSILETADGGYLFTSGSTSADKDIHNNCGAEDIWLFKTDINLNKEWSHNYGGTGNDRPASIIQNADEGFLIAGYTFSNNSDVTGGHGSADIWLLNLSCKVPETFLGTNLNACFGDTIQFANAVSFASQSQWNLNNIPISLQENNQILFPTSGVYTVSLNAQTCYYSATQSIDVTIGNCNLPAINFSADKKEICANGEVAFNDLCLRTVSWQWNFPGGSPSTSTLQNPIVTYTQPGVYNVMLTGNNSFGSQSSMRLSYVIVHPAPLQPVISIQGNTLTATLSNSYQWILNGSEIPSANSENFDIVISGYYSVLIEDQNSCRVKSDSIYFSTTGLTTVKDINDISIYPNPTSREITIQLDKKKKGKLSLINADGEKLKELKIIGDTDKYSIELENYPAGLYMVVFTDEKGKSVLNSIIKL